MPRCLVADYRGGPLCIPLAPSPLLHLERAAESSWFSRTSPPPSRPLPLLPAFLPGKIFSCSYSSSFPSLLLPVLAQICLSFPRTTSWFSGFKLFDMMRSQILILQDIQYPLDTLFCSALFAGSSPTSSLNGTHSTPHMESGSVSVPVILLYFDSSQTLSGPLWTPYTPHLHLF